ncbi:MAG TPA: potassium-transporting ATPase subunit B, partial [Desulfuromonas sp.]|nr:potassium-transporting ATPase subunit B [Desulfuromonas sp.]
MAKHVQQPLSIFSPILLRTAVVEALKKLDPRSLWRSPVMFLVEIGSAITLINFLLALTGRPGEPAWFSGLVSLWLWLTVFFGTFAEALAEGRGKARAVSLRKSRTEVQARRLAAPDPA